MARWNNDDGYNQLADYMYGLIGKDNIRALGEYYDANEERIMEDPYLVIKNSDNVLQEIWKNNLRGSAKQANIRDDNFGKFLDKWKGERQKQIKNKDNVKLGFGKGAKDISPMYNRFLEAEDRKIKLYDVDYKTERYTQHIALYKEKELNKEIELRKKDLKRYAKDPERLEYTKELLKELNSQLKEKENLLKDINRGIKTLEPSRKKAKSILGHFEKKVKEYAGDNKVSPNFVGLGKIKKALQDMKEQEIIRGSKNPGKRYDTWDIIKLDTEIDIIMKKNAEAVTNAVDINKPKENWRMLAALKLKGVNIENIKLNDDRKITAIAKKHGIHRVGHLTKEEKLLTINILDPNSFYNIHVKDIDLTNPKTYDKGIIDKRYKNKKADEVDRLYKERISMLAPLKEKIVFSLNDFPKNRAGYIDQDAFTTLMGVRGITWTTKDLNQAKKVANAKLEKLYYPTRFKRDASDVEKGISEEFMIEETVKELLAKKAPGLLIDNELDKTLFKNKNKYNIDTLSSVKRKLDNEALKFGKGDDSAFRDISTLTDKVYDYNTGKYKTMPINISKTDILAYRKNIEKTLPLVENDFGHAGLAITKTKTIVPVAKKISKDLKIGKKGEKQVEEFLEDYGGLY